MTPPDDSPRTGPDDPLAIDLWQWSLDRDLEAVAALDQLLTHDERQRAYRFVFDQDRTNFIVGRAGLRWVLANYARPGAREISFTYGPHGKPMATNVPVSFNISHSGAQAVAAVATLPEITLGIDVEHMRDVEPGLAQRFFSAAENEDLAQLDGEAWLKAFFRCWTRKEAVVKALGAGLSLELSRFDVSVRPDQPACIRSFDGDPSAGEAWRLCEFVPEDGYIGTVAVRTEGRPVRIVERGNPMPAVGRASP
jgi:4'-phosphopantetheinyl transferase